MKLLTRAQEVGKKITLITAAFVLAVSTLTASVPFILSQSVSALGPVIEIDTVAELRAAVENQADGQIWEIAAGEYGVSPFTSLTVSGQTGWYFPITANGLTIKGVGNPTIYGTGYSPNGNWATQNLVSVFGDNVTIEGLTLMPKVQPNKTLEVLGSNFTLRNTTFAPNTLTNDAEFASSAYPDWSRQWGGSLYFSHAGNHVVENVTIKNAGISYRYSPAGTNIAFTNTKIVYATNQSSINTYRYSSGFNEASNSVSGSIKVEHRVNAALNNLGLVASSAQDGDVIELDSDVTTTTQTTLKKAVTLNGNGHKITGNFVKTDNDNNSVLSVQSNNVAVNNLTVDAVTGTNQLHGINVFASDNVTLTNIIAKNGRSGVAVNGSKVTINGIQTSGNVWHGVNIDKPGAHLTIKGVNTHSEAAPLFVDNRTVGQVTDVENRYDIIAAGLGDIYVLDGTAPNVPTHQTPAANAVINTNNFWFDWSDESASGAVRYEIQNSQSAAVDGNGSFQNVQWTGDYQRIQPTDSKAQSIGASGTWYWQVRAIDAAGNASAWTAPWKVTIDQSGPTVAISNPANGELFGGLETHGLQKKTIAVQASASDANGLGAYCLKLTKVGSSEGGCVTGGYAFAPANGNLMTVNINTTTLASGNYIVKARVTDKANNATEVTRTVTIDNTKPVITTPITDGQTFEGTVNVELNSTEAHPKIHNIRVLNEAGAVVGGLYDANATSPNAVLAWNTRDAADGTYTIQFSSRDAVGNAATTVFRTVTVDNDFEAPVVGLSSTTENTATPTITGTIDDSTATVKIMLESIERDAVNNGDGTWSYVVPSALANGNYPVSVLATDSWGNASGAATGTLTIAVVPTVPINPTNPTNPTQGGEENEGEAPAGEEQPTTLSTVTTETPTIVSPVNNFAAILGTNTNDANDSEESDNSGTPEVEGTSTEETLAAAANNTDGNAFGLAWYWWLLILAGGATGAWWLFAAIRNRSAE